MARDCVGVLFSLISVEFEVCSVSTLIVQIRIWSIQSKAVELSVYMGQI